MSDQTEIIRDRPLIVPAIFFGKDWAKDEYGENAKRAFFWGLIQRVNVKERKKKGMEQRSGGFEIFCFGDSTAHFASKQDALSFLKLPSLESGAEPIFINT